MTAVYLVYSVGIKLAVLKDAMAIRMAEQKADKKAANLDYFVVE